MQQEFTNENNNTFSIVIGHIPDNDLSQTYSNKNIVNVGQVFYKFINLICIYDNLYANWENVIKV